jgi:hypothetical protein
MKQHATRRGSVPESASHGGFFAPFHAKLAETHVNLLIWRFDAGPSRDYVKRL